MTVPLQRLLVLVVAVLVNLPWAHTAWGDHRLAEHGVEVAATVSQTRVVNRRHLVDYRLPKAVDPERGRYTTDVTEDAWQRIRASKVLPVLVLPDDPGVQRPLDAPPSHLFAVMAVVADLVLLLLLAGWWWRRRVLGLVVREVAADGALVVRWPGLDLDVRAEPPPGWAGVAGDAVPGRLVLLADSDVLPTETPRAPEQLDGVRVRAWGRVTDVGRDRTTLQLGSEASGARLLVRTDARSADGLMNGVVSGTRRWRNRADLRQFAVVTGRLVIEH